MTFNYPVWWGGYVSGAPTPPEIGLKLRQIRDSVGGLLARRSAGGPSYPIRSAKELVIKLREAIDEAGCHAMVAKVKVTHVPTERGTCALVKSTVHICAPDGSYAQFEGVGHGSATDDKGAGKASTYAYKDALCKGLTVPDQEMPDTDDEEGVPTERWDRMAALYAINNCKSGAELDALKAKLSRLSNDDRLALTPAYLEVQHALDQSERAGAGDAVPRPAPPASPARGTKK